MKTPQRPEAILLSSIEETDKKVRSSLMPIVDDHVNNQQYDHDKDGLDYLKAKNSLIISYMIDFTQLIQLKSSKVVDKERVKSCESRLREMRTIMEKIRPLEKKLRYQLDKLLSYSSTSFASNITDDQSEDIITSESTTMNSDPLAFRPNPELMDGKYDEDDISVDDAQNDDLITNRPSLKSDESDDESVVDKNARNDHANKSQREKEGLYKIPRLAAVPFTGDKTSHADKEERILKKQRDRMRKSELLSTLKATFGDAPEEDDFEGGASLGKQREAALRLSQKEAEQSKFEEDAMIRLTKSRKDNKLKNKIMREEISNLHSIAEVGNLACGVSTAFKSNQMDGNRKRMRSKDDRNKNSGNRVLHSKNSLQEVLYSGHNVGNRKRMKKKKK